MRRFLIDTDTASDDAVALVMALRHPEVRVEAITVVAGNVPVEQGVQNALYTVELTGTDVPVYQGMGAPLLRPHESAQHVHGSDGMGDINLDLYGRTPAPEHATDVLQEFINRYPGETTLVTLGPLTNVALALLRDPSLASKVRNCVIMGGTGRGHGNVTPVAEYNIWVDPEAAHRVFTSGLDVTMIGLDVTHKALLGRQHAERLRGSGRVGRMVAELLDFYGRFHEETYGFDGSPVHDAVAVAHVARPGLVETVERAVVVDCGGERSRGRTYVDLWRRTDWPVNSQVAVRVDAGSFVSFLLERLTSLR